MNDGEVKVGVYRHYKGKFYTVLGVAQHSETCEELVVYRAEYGARGLWVRPRRMFEEDVEIDGQRVKRFVWVGDENLIVLDDRLTSPDGNQGDPP